MTISKSMGMSDLDAAQVGTREEEVQFFAQIPLEIFGSDLPTAHKKARFPPEPGFCLPPVPFSTVAPRPVQTGRRQCFPYNKAPRGSLLR
jgi:hypothetical protein